VGGLTKSRLAYGVLGRIHGLEDIIKSEKWCGRHFGLELGQHWDGQEAFETIEGSRSWVERIKELE